MLFQAPYQGVLQVASQRPYAATHPGVYVGVYAIRFCHGACSPDASDRDRTGTLVLSGVPLRNRRGWLMRQWLERYPINGCLTLDATHEVGGTGPFDARTPRRRFVTWAKWPDQDMASFEFERSPDGGYSVMLRLSAVGLTGRATIWGGVAGAVQGASSPIVFDQVVARRVGEPGPGDCPRPPPRRRLPGGSGSAGQQRRLFAGSSIGDPVPLPGIASGSARGAP